MSIKLLKAIFPCPILMKTTNLKGEIEMGYLNFGSLLLGLIAWILPIVNLAKHNKAEHKNWVAFSIASFIACSVSLFFQIVYQDYLVKIEDWSAIMDTSGALVLVSAVLIVVTIVLNIIALLKYRRINENMQK